MAERLTQAQVETKLAQVAEVDDPLVGFYHHVTKEALEFNDRTREVKDADYLQDPSLLIEAVTRGTGVAVRVRFLESKVRGRLTHAMEFVNGETFARVYPWGLNPFDLDPDKWDASTIGPGYVLAIDRHSMSRQQPLLDKFHEAVSSHSFHYPRVRPPRGL